MDPPRAGAVPPGDLSAEPITELLGNTHTVPSGIRLIVLSGPDKGRSAELRRGTHTVGKSPACALTLSDVSVSREHLEIVLFSNYIAIRDLGSTNGSYYQGARFESISVGVGASIVLGQTEIGIEDLASGPPVSTSTCFGALLGVSTAMRQVFGVLERIASSEVSVLVQGETGTGKELVAEAIHAASPRKRGAFVVCDLGAVPRTLIESELFGHVRGSFTGAERDREGAFCQADNGTIFLDEVGELDMDVQPRLLRALERGHVKPVGGSTYRTVSARLIAATNRDLLSEVTQGHFREDLYHRLAVVRVLVPPLRERPEDIVLLVEHFLATLSAAQNRAPPRVPPATMAALRLHDWPGNVRELRNVLERALSLAPDADELDPTLLGLEARPRSRSAPRVDPSLPFKVAKDSLIEAWEREYLTALLAKAGGNVSMAARQAGIDRVYLHRLMRKHCLGDD